MYKTVMIPIDMAHIEEGKAMVEAAKVHAAKDARIILLNVVEEVPSYVAAELPSGILDKSKESAFQELKAVVEEAGIEADVEIRAGHPYRTILEAAEDDKVDLIIIASHKPGLQDYFLGSTAARVVRHASCSVLVVR